jgi:hypothetical protein
MEKASLASPRVPRDVRKHMRHASYLEEGTPPHQKRVRLVDDEREHGEDEDNGDAITVVIDKIKDKIAGRKL